MAKIFPNNRRALLAFLHDVAMAAVSLMLLFSHPTVTAETTVGLAAQWADKFGYILAAPVWGNTFSGPYDWSGDAHALATDVLRDVLSGFDPADIAEILVHVPDEDDVAIFRLLPRELAARVFAYLPLDHQEGLIRSKPDLS